MSDQLLVNFSRKTFFILDDPLIKNQKKVLINDQRVKMLDDTLTKQCKEILRKNNLNPSERLGKGGFGTVYLVSKIDFQTYDTELYAIKCTYKKNFAKKPMLRRYLKQEINIMAGLDHPNIVKLIQTFQDQGWIFMVMEYCNMGNLNSMLSKRPNKILPFHEAKTILLEVMEAISYMHQKKLVHRDIKPENILLTKNQLTGELQTKICDLGFSREISDQADTVCGTTDYMAPEIFDKKKYDNKVDIWALGVLFYFMLFGNVPFKSINMSGIIHSKCEHGFNLDSMKTKHNAQITTAEREFLKDLFRKIFHLNPSERPSIEQIKNILQKRDENYPLKNIVQKETIESEISSEDQKPLYIQEVQFIQSVLKDVKQLSFLSQLEEITLKYYLDKVCLSILNQNSHVASQCKYFNTWSVDKIQRSQKSQTKLIAKNIQTVPINKFQEVFSLQTTNQFQNFKEAYRLVVGHAFYKAHKKIENNRLKCQIKLKLFCCHVINRVFVEQYNRELFKRYFQWQNQSKKISRLNLVYFKEWIEMEKSQYVLESVEAINKKFYQRKE